MNNLISAKIDLSACINNCKKLKKLAAKRKLFAVVKADAYGHGMKEISLAIKNNVDGYCVFEVNDAKKLRTLKLKHPILVMGGVANNLEIKTIIKHKLMIAINNHQQVNLCRSYAKEINRIFIKVHTGMNRLGFRPEEVPAIVESLQQAGAKNIALMHHYAKSEIPKQTNAANLTMQKLARKLKLPFTASNTGGVLMNKDPGEEFVRCGIGIYGAYPLSYANIKKLKFGLTPVMTVTSKVIAINNITKGQSVGYGSIWTAKKNCKIAIIAAGYAHGYPRSTPIGTKVLCNNKLFSTVGRVSMEMIAIDLGNNLDDFVKVGDEVQLWGKEISVDKLAQINNTIGYELLASLPAKVKKIYIS